MEKRLLLAITLSLAIIISWGAIASKFYPVEKQRVIKTTAPVPLPLSRAVENRQVLGEVQKELPQATLILGKQEFTFLLPYAAIKEVLFKDYQDYRFSLGEGFFWKAEDLDFKKEKLAEEAYFTYEDAEKRISKRFLIHNSNYSIDLNIKIQNLKTSPLNINLELLLARLDLHNAHLYTRLQEVVLALKDKIVRFSPNRAYNSAEEIKFLAFRDRYFCAIIEPDSAGFRGFVNKVNSKEVEIGLSAALQIEPAGERDLNFHIYLGPQNLQMLSALNKAWNAVVYFGTFDAISKFLLKLLTLFQGLVRNWGVALVLLSLFIYLVLYPLTLKQMHSMKKMQELQPKIEQLRQLYKNNPQKLNKAVLELYRQEKINPFGGCLPLVLQIPIFFALYQALMRSLELKGQPFLWIKDLSEPDKLFILPNTLPFLGNELNLLPLLMTAIMFVQQRFSQTPGVGQAAEQQRLMTIIFPLMFGAIFYHMPSGLVLYWLINSALMTLYQFKIKTRH